MAPLPSAVRSFVRGGECVVALPADDDGHNSAILRGVALSAMALDWVLFNRRIGRTADVTVL